MNGASRSGLDGPDGAHRLDHIPVAAPISGASYSTAELSEDNGTVYLLDQRRLPAEEIYLGLTDASRVAEAIGAMVVRGAPAIGITAAYALALAAGQARAGATSFMACLAEAGETLRRARPTAVNLGWAVDRMLLSAGPVASRSPAERARVLSEEARRIHREDVAACQAMGELGAALVPQGSVVLTHCNAGALATGGYGTALGVVRSAFRQGRIRGVLAGETRPYLQGARLTAWELVREGIPVEIVTDGMAGHLMQQGEVGVVIVGADRVARSGDVANKIGTYGLSVLARAHGLPLLVAAPTSTVDLACARGEDIVIEQRSSDEVTRLGGVSLAPVGVRARHPAFDVTPARLVTALITERGIAAPPGEAALVKLLGEAEAACG